MKPRRLNNPPSSRDRYEVRDRDGCLLLVSYPDSPSQVAELRARAKQLDAEVVTQHGRRGNAARRVRCVETGEVFATVTAAAGKSGCSGAKQMCDTIKRGRPADGLHYVYV